MFDDKKSPKNVSVSRARSLFANSTSMMLSANGRPPCRPCKAEQGCERRQRPSLQAADFVDTAPRPVSLLYLSRQLGVQSRITRFSRPVASQLGARVRRAQGCARSAASSTDVLSADNTHWEKKRCFLVTFCHRTKSYPLAKTAEAPRATTISGPSGMRAGQHPT